MTIVNYRHHHSTRRLSKATEEAAANCVSNLSNWAAAVQEIQTWPEYEPQPLRSLP